LSIREGPKICKKIRKKREARRRRREVSLCLSFVELELSKGFGSVGRVHLVGLLVTGARSRVKGFAEGTVEGRGVLDTVAADANIHKSFLVKRLEGEGRGGGGERRRTMRASLGWKERKSMSCV